MDTFTDETTRGEFASGFKADTADEAGRRY